ncbi:putative GPI-anchored adhesin-like protein [Heracleum sosnowskyi]|uniref:GPI-anchored adhesin-like protein n=1 Tax=Heracleum sosnowskyi TaxID=360622 RepID=A0AAD8MHT8_9APIA|nr:putative GPI-anchored adhesin-like protein [Heracleum sosnowskyi]
MGKRRQRNAQPMEKDEAGCISGLIRMFDVRDGRFTRKLLVDRKHGSRNPAGADTKLKMITYKDEKGTATEDVKEMTTDNLKPSVKKLIEEEMFDEKGLKKNMNIAGAQHVGDKPKQSKRNHSKSCDMHANDLDVAEHSSQQLSNKETPYNLDLEVMLEELCQLNQKSSSCEHDWHDSRSNQVYSLVQEELGAAIKVFISQRFSDNGHLGEDSTILHSKEFIDALEILGVNKELFSEHLHDPNSLLAKHIQRIENGHLTKDQHTNPLFESSLLDQEPNKPSSEKLSDQKHHSFFRRRRRRSKSLDSNSLKDDDKCQPSSTIVILKPGSTAPQNSGTKSLLSTSSESQWTVTDRSKTGRNVSQFSLSEIKKKLRHVMSIEWHGVSRSSESPREFKNLKSHEKGVVEGNSGWSSPNRNHFFTERFAKSLLGVKKDGKIDRPEGSETITVNEVDGNPKQGIPKIYNEAKKHLSEMVSNGEEKEVSESKQIPKTLAKILSLPEYSSTPSASPGNSGNHKFVTAQVKSSPPSKFDISQETMPCIIQDNHVGEYLPPKQCLESDSCISVEEPDDKIPSGIFAPHKLGEHSYDNRVEGAMSSAHDDEIREELLEIVTTDSNLRENNQVEEVSCTSSSLHLTREIEILDAAEIPEEEKSLKVLKLNPIMNDVPVHSPPVSPASPITTIKIESFDDCIDRADRPSPISILEPLDSDDEISPASSKLLPVKETIEPLHICFNEWDSSDVNQTVRIRTCMEDEESAFEYVEAVLLGSGLNWEEYLFRWLLSDQILDPSLFDEVELFSSRSHDQKLLFDCTDNVLKETCERYFTRSLVKQGIHPVPNGMKLINEVWEGVEMKILQPPASHSLEQLVRKDMPKFEKWMDLYFETDHIVIELENFIIEEMLEELILISNDRTTEDWSFLIFHASASDEENVIDSAFDWGIVI